MIEQISIVIVSIWTLFLVFQLSFRTTHENQELREFPLVSILIPLRNEAHNVKRLCENLEELNYPKSKIEILFADDESDDDTFDLLKKYLPNNAQVFGSIPNNQNLVGKSRVLSFLANKAQGEYLLFTDADMLFHPDWVQNMISQTSHGSKILVGFTEVRGEGWWSKMQNIDWLSNEWIIHCFSKVGVYLAAWGNNMLISKKDYLETGGFEEIGPTIVEDVALMRACLKKDGQLKVVSSVQAVGSTHSIGGIMELIQQRKRWMSGIKGLNPIWFIGYLIKLFFWPALVFLIVINIKWLILFFIALFCKILIYQKVPQRQTKKPSIIQVLCFECYDFVFYLITFVFYFLPFHTIWKGRNY